MRLLKLLMDLRDRHPIESGDPTLQHIRRLLSGYPYLIAELNAFLPNVCKPDLPNQSRDPKPTSTLDDGGRFVSMVADRLSEEKFKRFLVLLDQSRKTGSLDYIEIQKLLSDHADLIQNFEIFKQGKTCGKRRHAGSSHAEKVEWQVKHSTGMVIKSAAQSKSKMIQKQDGIGCQAGNIEDDDNTVYALEDAMYELDMRFEWYSQLHREIKKFLEYKKDFKSELSSELIQLEDYLCPKSITCMTDLFCGSRDHVMEYLNERGEETLSHMLRHLEEQKRQRTQFGQKARSHIGNHIIEQLHGVFKTWGGGLMDGGLWLLVLDGGLFLSKGTGISEDFEEIPVQSCGFRILDVGYLSQDEAWASGGCGILLRTSNGGKTWTRGKAADNIAANLYSVKFIDDNKGFVLGNDGVLLRYVG
ncbi:hypothetical protein J5N97_023759 [Dioscorea zingiberensis]|uniref:Photosynthesis system II assembly factor Ycf48/Hcf136-like domain-containing protein n=1 Tax=Dioscorea zingiberensis TaxID=325984 RepID=A0A9D5H8A2_9LILI|nr:hypothetical protein J5N97_023759 [Dioscorea zingiberensis]